MRILFVSTIYPTPAEPGKGVFNRNLVRALAARHEVTVLAPVPWIADPPWRAPAHGSLGPNRVRTLDGITVHHPRYYYPPKVMYIRAGWFYWRSVRASAARTLTGFTPDLVLGYWAYPDGAVAGRIARSVGARSAVIVGGSDVLLDTRSPGRRKRVIESLSGADAVLSVSDDLRRKVIELGVPATNSKLWRQGTETDLFQPGDQGAARERLVIPSGEPVLVWVGRMVPVKGLDVLVRACAALKQRSVGFRLFLIGDGPLRAGLEAECRRLGIADRVKFCGACGHERLADWYRAADLTVLPSRSEGLPNTLRESAACGTPFVASRVGGIAEIADDRLDRLVPPENVTELADAIARSLAGRDSRPQRHYRPSSWAEAADDLIDLCRPLSAPAETRPQSPARV